ncbi:metal-dependent hydrolase [Aurantiacibacter sp. D1-12]|nr:metal-dependent hydrolase [Aurantiacibacter sp. D1-12]
MTHAIVPLALAAAAGPSRIAPKVALVGAGLAMLPDADVIGFAFGIEYADPWGHRGATHSLVFATLTAAGIALVWKRARSLWAFFFLALAMASHGLLDTFTDGGLGAALWWPFDNARVFAPVTPVRVSPIGADFFSARGLETLLSELVWIWLPCAVLAFAGWRLRHATPPRP